MKYIIHIILINSESLKILIFKKGVFKDMLFINKDILNKINDKYIKKIYDPLFYAKLFLNKGCIPIEQKIVLLNKKYKYVYFYLNKI
jgi:hypothetical protein